MFVNGKNTLANFKPGVIAREALPKTRVPLATIFAVNGPPRLTLVTCGPFDRAARSYRDNIVITAVPG